MKLSDYVTQFISRYAEHVFVLVGGGAMHLNDSLRAAKITPVFMLHEQGAAFAAQAYGHLNGLGVCMTTSGPGATNAITGCLAAWMDSTPVLFISGQVATSQRADVGQRYKGVQEADTIAMVKPITKYAVEVTEPGIIRYVLERAVHEATSGRKGPVWLSIPLDVQCAEIVPERLYGFAEPLGHETSVFEMYSQREQIWQLLKVADRPLILAGHGVQARGCEDAFRRYVEQLGAPVLLTWKAIGLLPDDHPCYVGRPGGIGQPAANRILQECDVLLVLGAKMDLDQTAYQLERIAPHALKMVVDIDLAELRKFGNDWVRIHADLAEIL